MSSGNRPARRRACGCRTRASPLTAGADKLRVAVLGAGSIGCFVGGCWKAAGIDVKFIGRERIGAALAERGLTLTDYSGWQASFAAGLIDYHVGPQPLAEADLIALTVKSAATAEAAKQIRDHGRPGSTVISLQNGISNVEELERELAGDFTVVRGMVPFNVAYLGDGRFHKGVAGELFADDVPATRRLADAIGRSPASLKLSDDMPGIAWGKLLINLNNAVNALSGQTLLEELRERDYRRVFAASMREGLRLLDRAGIKPAKVGAVGPRMLPWVIGSPDWLFRNLFMKAWKIDAKARSSMADDLDAGRRTEIDFITGELVRLAEKLHEQAPVNRKVVELIRQAEGGAPPLSPTELRRAVLGG